MSKSKLKPPLIGKKGRKDSIVLIVFMIKKRARGIRTMGRIRKRHGKELKLQQDAQGRSGRGERSWSRKNMDGENTEGNLERTGREGC